jgi:hypothetical protein
MAVYLLHPKNEPTHSPLGIKKEDKENTNRNRDAQIKTTGNTRREKPVRRNEEQSEMKD